MTDLLQVLVDFPTAQFSHLLPSLDRALITTSDLLTLDAIDIAKRAQLPPAEVGKLADAILKALHGDLGVDGIEGKNDTEGEKSNGKEYGAQDVNELGTRQWRNISTLDEHIDEALGGGIPTGYVTEFTGESGAGKTQFLLTLLLSSQLAPPHGLSAPSLYISTEAALSTSRLAQLLRQNPTLSSLPLEQRPSLNKILSIQTPDLEAQDHILRYQVPVAIERQGVGLVVIDSIASNYRAEFERTGVGSASENGQGVLNPDRRAGQAMAERRTQLVQLGGFLRNLAREKNIAIVLSNQVADRFSPVTTLPPQNHLPPPSASSIPVITPDPLTLDHQQRWFTGWGDIPGTNFKTPSLGLVWTNQIGARIALIKDGDIGSQKRRRWLRVVFAPWVGGSRDRGLEYEILGEGVRAMVGVGDGDDDEKKGNQ